MDVEVGGAVVELGADVESEVGVGVDVDMDVDVEEVGGMYVEVDPGSHVSHKMALPLKGTTRNIAGVLDSFRDSLLYDSRRKRDTTMENSPA